MANSNIISQFKEKIVKAMTKDSDIVSTLDAPDCENGGDLLNSRIFKYNKNPNTIDDVITFITVMVHTKSQNKHATFVTPTLEIWVYTHQDHMQMDARITKDNRCDYLSKLLDEKFNESTEYGGIGTLKLMSNDEGNFNSEFLFRRLVFQTVDLNNSLCGGSV